MQVLVQKHSKSTWAVLLPDWTMISIAEGVRLTGVELLGDGRAIGELEALHGAELVDAGKYATALLKVLGPRGVFRGCTHEVDSLQHPTVREVRAANFMGDRIFYDPVGEKRGATNLTDSVAAPAA